MNQTQESPDGSSELAAGSPPAEACLKPLSRLHRRRRSGELKSFVSEAEHCKLLSVPRDRNLEQCGEVPRKWVSRNGLV